MIITHLAVEGVGRFRDRHVVKGLGPGLNLLCAPNEAGKSTLFRALRACLFSKHTTADRNVVGPLTIDSAKLAVKIGVSFTKDGHDYAIEKSFVEKKRAILSRDGVSLADNAAADEEVWKILGLNGSARADEAAFGLLWVEQGGSFEEPDPNQTAVAQLHRLIEAEIGQVLGGARGDQVRARVLSELEKEETSRGAKAGGAWKAAQDAVSSLTAEKATAESAVATLEADLETLASKRNELRRQEDPAIASELDADIAAAQAEWDRIEKSVNEANAAANEAENFRLALERAWGETRKLHDAHLKISAARAALTALTAQLADEETAACELGRAAEEAAKTTESLEAERERTEAEWERLSRISAAGRMSREIGERRSALTRARDLQDRLAALDAQIAKENLPRATAETIERLAATADVAARAQAAAAPQIRIEPGPDARDLVRYRGETIVGPLSEPVLSHVRIEIGAMATIEVIPVVAAEAIQAVENARTALADALHRAGLNAMAEMRRKRAACAALETERGETAAALSAVASGEDGIAQIEAELAKAEAEAAGLAVGEDESALDPVVLEQRREAAALRRDAARDAARARRTVDRAAQSDASHQGFVVAKKRGEIADKQNGLEETLALYPDETRATRLGEAVASVEAARIAHGAALEKSVALATAAPSNDDRETIRLRIATLIEARDRRRDYAHALDRDIAKLEGSIATRGGEGVGERLVTLEQELGVAQRDLAAIERKLKSLRLLRKTIEECRSEARDAYLAPVMAAMRPMLHTLLPGADAVMNEKFEITDLARGGGSEKFDLLSDGTREQIGIVTRLALGRVLAQRGQPVPILLDDALVFSDDERIERMFDVLTLAAERQQVIVLTCRSRVFQRFGGRRLTIEREGA